MEFAEIYRYTAHHIPEGKEMSRVCSHRHVRMLDNFVRPFIHNPVKLFDAYLKPGMSALDIGCGGGFAAIGMARLVGDEGRVVAADVQLEMLSEDTSTV